MTLREEIQFIKAAGTSEGAEKAWNTRGRGRHPGANALLAKHGFKFDRSIGVRDVYRQGDASVQVYPATGAWNHFDEAEQISEKGADFKSLTNHFGGVPGAVLPPLPDAVVSGTPTAAGKTELHHALQGWTTGVKEADNEIDPQYLNKLVTDLSNGKRTPGAVALADMARTARSDLAGTSPTVMLYRGESASNQLTGINPRMNSAVSSYATSKKAVETFLSADHGGKLPADAKVITEQIPRDRIVAYYKQSAAFLPEEQEVIVSHKAIPL